MAATETSTRLRSGSSGDAVAASGAASGRAANRTLTINPVAVGRGRLAFPVLVFLLCVVVPFAFSLGPVVMTGVRVTLILLVVPMAIGLFTGRFGRILPTDYLFFVHLAWATLALGINNPQLVVQNMGATGIEFIGGYLLGRAYIRTKEDFIALIRASVWIVILTLPIAIVETITGRQLVIEMLQAIPFVGGAVRAPSEARLGLERVQLGFATPIHYGLYCSLSFALCFVGLKSVYGGFKRWLASFLVGLGVFISLSSGAFLAMMLMMFLIFWTYALRKSKRPWTIFFYMVAFFYVAIDLASNRTPYRVFMTYATFSPGTAYWRAAINEFGMNNVWANPIFGLGLRPWVRPGWMQTSSVDNFWLLMAMRFGILGFLTVAAGYGTALWQVAWRKFGDDQILLQLRLAWMFTFSSLAFTMFTVHVWSEIYALVFFYVGAGLWMVTAVPEGAAVPAAAPLRGSLQKRSRIDPKPAADVEARTPDAPTLRPVAAHSRAPEPQRRSGAAAIHRVAPGPAEPGKDEKGRSDQPVYTRFPTNNRDPKA